MLYIYNAGLGLTTTLLAPIMHHGTDSKCSEVAYYPQNLNSTKATA